MLLQQSQLSSMIENSSCLRRMRTRIRFWCVFQAVRVSIWAVAANAVTEDTVALGRCVVNAAEPTGGAQR